MSMQNGAAVGLEERIGILAGRIHAATAELVDLSAALDSDGTWSGIGMRTCAHWLSINIGVDVWVGGEMVRAGHALKNLPALHAAFADERLSFDKIRAVTKVATPADDELWLEIALQASGGQLARICRGVRRALEADDPRHAGDALLNRGLRLWWRDDGMLEFLGVLPKEEGAIVVAAIEAAAHRIATEERQVPSPDQLELAAEHKTHPMLRADAFVRLCETWINASAQTPVLAPTTQVVVHVDEAVLKGAATGGRSRIEDGPWLPLAAVRRLSCDADVVTIIERGGLPIDVGRIHRLITPRLRLALQSRDEGCRFPGSSVPAPCTDGHHLKHWIDGGRTDLDNLLSLCRFHHRRHHEGEFRIQCDGPGNFTFTAADGKPLVPVIARPAFGHLEESGGKDPTVAHAREGGAPFDYEYAVSALADASVYARSAESLPHRV
jgi:Domain of unknown function (DUF222)/HNH endonuclease